MSITIKSNIKNRVRLKSSLFQDGNYGVLEELLSDKVVALRMNSACNSLIINYDSSVVSLDEILEEINLLFHTKKEQILENITSNKSCDICSSCHIEKYNPKSFRLRLLEFGFLSVVAVVVFVKEHILDTAFSVAGNIFLGSVSVIAALPLLNDAKNDIVNKKFTLETFMSFSLLLAIFGGEIGAAFEVIYILRASKLFEEYLANKSRTEIKNLIKMEKKKLFVLRDEIEIEIDLEDVAKGDTAVFVSGEQIPVDGVIIKGDALINESIINGHSQAIHKKKDDEVFANTIVEEGRIYVKVLAVGDETYISRVVNDVEKYLSLKSPSEVMADQLARKVLRLGTFLTISTLLLTGSFANAFSVMIVMSCPCATILAASSAVSSAIASAAKSGILIKGGEYLENVSKADVFCFDKTGTLTTTEPQVVGHYTNLKEDEFLQVLANLEHKNTHPIAKAILKYCDDLGYTPKDDALVCNIIGLGVECGIDGNSYSLGSKKFIQDLGVKVPANSKFIKENSHNTVVYLAKNSKFAGAVSIIHKVRDGSKEAILELKKRGVKKIVLLTGDDEKVANEFAKEFEFDAVYPNLMPDEKAKIVEELSKESRVVMIGDGVNDTLAMSKADIGISFASGGSKAAVQVSNIAITNSDPLDIVRLYDLSQFALKVANQNYHIGTSTNIIGSILAFFGRITPAGAGLVHIGHTSLILGNSSRVKIDDKTYEIEDIKEEKA
ncbi:MAG: cation-translocating P-type ATPase [Campylobacteraceae bacterium]|nr:cation-translocating P-type ATPase [Campylobacteraceae bacterium]